MIPVFEGKRVKLTSIRGGQPLSGWIIRCSGLNWVVNMVDETPKTGDQIKVLVPAQEEYYSVLAKVAAVKDTAAVLACTGEPDRVPDPSGQRAFEMEVNQLAFVGVAGKEYRIRITKVRDTSFDFVSDEKLSTLELAEFRIPVRGQITPVLGTIIEFESGDDGNWLGKSQVSISGRVFRSYWSSIK